MPGGVVRKLGVLTPLGRV